MTTYTYNIPATPKLSRIYEGVAASSMTNKNIVSCSYTLFEYILSVVWDTDLSTEDKAILDSIIAAIQLPEEETMQIKLGQGSDLRLKWIGYKFTATASTTTNYDFQLPYDLHIQEGIFVANESKTGDVISLIAGYGTPYAFAYLDAVPVTKGEVLNPKEEFGMTSMMPAGFPIRVAYENTDTTDKIITFKLGIRLPE